MCVRTCMRACVHAWVVTFREVAEIAQINNSYENKGREYSGDSNVVLYNRNFQNGEDKYKISKGRDNFLCRKRKYPLAPGCIRTSHV